MQYFQKKKTEVKFSDSLINKRTWGDHKRKGQRLTHSMAEFTHCDSQTEWHIFGKHTHSRELQRADYWVLKIITNFRPFFREEKVVILGPFWTLFVRKIIIMGTIKKKIATDSLTMTPWLSETYAGHTHTHTTKSCRLPTPVRLKLQPICFFFFTETWSLIFLT